MSKPIGVLKSRALHYANLKTPQKPKQLSSENWKEAFANSIKLYLEYACDRLNLSPRDARFENDPYTVVLANYLQVDGPSLNGPRTYGLVHLSGLLWIATASSNFGTWI